MGEGLTQQEEGAPKRRTRFGVQLLEDNALKVD